MNFILSLKTILEEFFMNIIIDFHLWKTILRSPLTKKNKNMTSIKTHLLRDNSIFVGEKEKSLNLIHSFYISEGLSDLERFLQQNSAEARYFNQAFAYWVLCALGRCKEDIKRYGILTRKLINFSKKLWNHLRSLSKKSGNQDTKLSRCTLTV